MINVFGAKSRSSPNLEVGAVMLWTMDNAMSVENIFSPFVKAGAVSANSLVAAGAGEYSTKQNGDAIDV